MKIYAVFIYFYLSKILYLTPVDKTDPNISVHAPRRNSGQSSRHMARPGPPDSDEAMGYQMYNYVNSNNVSVLIHPFLISGQFHVVARIIYSLSWFGMSLADLVDKLPLCDEVLRRD